MDNATWRGVKRCDGVLIVQSFEGDFFAFPPDEGPVVCCGYEVTELAEAQAFADRRWPLPVKPEV